MSKKLLAAALAAAFLATGGMAKAGTDYEYNRQGSPVWTTGTHFNGEPTGTVTASGASGGTPVIGIYAIDTSSGAGVTTTATLEALAGGTINIGSTVGGTTGSVSVTPIDLTITKFNVRGGTLNVITGLGTLRTTAASTVGTNGTLTVGGALALGADVTNEGFIDLSTVGGAGNLDFSRGNINNAATTPTTFDPSKITTKTDLNVGIKVNGATDTSGIFDKVVASAAAAGASGNTGHILVTGAVRDDSASRDLSSTLGAGSILTFENVQTGNTNAFKLGDGAANLTADASTSGTTNIYSADFIAKTVYAGFSGNVNGTTITGDLDTEALVINNGTLSDGTLVRLGLDSAAASFDTSEIDALVVGSDATAGQYSTVVLSSYKDGSNANGSGKDFDLASTAVTNYGTIDITTFDVNVTLDEYAAGGIITNAGNGNAAGGGGAVTTAIDNEDLGNIVAALRRYDGIDAGSDPDNTIGDLFLAGAATKDVALAEGIEDGNVILDTAQTGAAFNLGKKVDLYAAGGTLGPITAQNAILSKDETLAAGKHDTAITLDIVNTGTAPTTGVVTVAKGAELVGNYGNDILFNKNNNTLLNHGVLDLTGTDATKPPNGQIIDFDYSTGLTNSTIANDGTIKLGKYTKIDNSDNGKIDNFTLDNAKKVTQGTIELDGAFDSNAHGMGDFIETLQRSLTAQAGTPENPGEIGKININTTLESNFDITSGGSFSTNLPKSGTVTLSNQDQSSAKKGDVNVAGADVNLDNDTNKVFNGNVNAKNITFTNKTGKQDSTYTGTMTATKGDIVIEDGGIYKGTFATSDEVNSSTSEVETYHGTLLKRGGTATFNGAEFNTHYQAGIGTLTKITGADSKIIGTGSFETLDDATIEFGELDSRSPGSPQILAAIQGSADPKSFIDLDPTTNLTVELNAARKVADADESQLVFDKNALASVTDKNVLETVMNNSSLTTIYERGGYFKIDENSSDDGVYYWHEVADDATQSIDNLLEDQGIGQYRGMISDTTLNSQFEIAKLYSAGGTDYDNLGIKDQYLVDTFNLASGYTVKGNSLSSTSTGYNPNEAYSIEQWKNGADWAGAVEAVTDTVRNFNRAITNRAYNIGHLLNQVEYDECGNVIASCGGFKNRIWAGYTGQWDKLEDRGWDKGYKYDAHGFNVGYDHVTSSGVGFGAAFGYSKGDYKNYGSLYNGDKSKIDNYSFGLFASYNHAGGFFTTLSGTYTYSKYKMVNGFTDYGLGLGGGYDNAKFHGDSWSVGGKIGYDFSPVANLTITPTVGLYYYSTRTNRFDSTFRNGMKYSRHTVEAPIDITAKYDIAIGCDSTLSLMGTAGYAYNFHNKGTKISGFTMGDTLDYGFGDHRMTKPGRSSWNVGGGAQFRYKNVDFGVHYEYYGRKDFRSHNLNANVGYSF